MGEGHLGLTHLDSNSLNEMLIHTEPKLSVYDSYTATVLITQDTGHSVGHVAENSYTQTSKCSQQKFTNKSYKQCVCIYTRMHQHQTWPNTGHNMERVPQSF